MADEQQAAREFQELADPVLAAGRVGQIGQFSIQHGHDNT